jgi:hypothetical protein
MVLPLAEIVSLLKQGLGNLLRQTGLELMHLVMDEEVKSLAGERNEQHHGRRAHRWGKEDAYCVDPRKIDCGITQTRSSSEERQVWWMSLADWVMAGMAIVVAGGLLFLFERMRWKQW